MDIVEDLDQLREHIEDTKQFMGMTFGLNKSECVTLLRQMHKMLPDQVKEAAIITRDSDRIVKDAREDAQSLVEKAEADAERIRGEARQQAEQIIELAKREREQMVQESEIVKLAKLQAEKLTVEADNEASKVKRGAEDYALHVLFQLDNVVTKVQSTIERGRSELQKSGGAPPAQTAEPT